MSNASTLCVTYAKFNIVRLVALSFFDKLSAIAVVSISSMICAISSLSLCGRFK